MVAASFTEVEAARNCRVSIWNVEKRVRHERLVLDCVGMVTVVLTVLSGVPSWISISDHHSQQKNTDENAAWRHQLKRVRTPCRISNCRSEIFANGDGIGVDGRRKYCKCFCLKSSAVKSLFVCILFQVLLRQQSESH